MQKCCNYKLIYHSVKFETKTLDIQRHVNTINVKV